MEILLEEIFKLDNSEWDYQVHIHEAAEQYLGTEQFYTLEKRFAAVPGIEAVRQEDRDVFLVRSKTSSAEEIKKEFWKQFTEAARIAFNKEK